MAKYRLSSRLKRRYNMARWRVRHRVSRVGRAWRYLTEHITQDDANAIIYDCQHIAAWWPLITFDNEGTLESARDVFEDHPALPELVQRACERVAHKWCGDGGETAGAAQDWALKLIPEYAAQDGINLKRLDEEEGARQ